MLDMTPSGKERRLTFQLLVNWEEIRGTRSYPKLDEMKLGNIGNLEPFCFIIDLCGDDPDRHLFHYFGSALEGMFDGDCTGENVRSCFSWNEKLQHTIGFYEDILTTQMPATQSDHFSIDGKHAVYRTLIVPISSDGTTIDYALGTTNYKILDD